MDCPCLPEHICLCCMCPPLSRHAPVLFLSLANRLIFFQSTASLSCVISISPRSFLYLTTGHFNCSFYSRAFAYVGLLVSEGRISMQVPLFLPLPFSFGHLHIHYTVRVSIAFSLSVRFLHGTLGANNLG